MRWFRGRLCPLVVLAAVTSAALTGGTAHAQAPYPAPAVADSEEVGAAERWALLGIGLPAGAAFAFTLGSGLDKGNHPTWHYATVGGLYGLAALWGTSFGYYRAGRPVYATLSGLAKTALVGGGLLFESWVHSGCDRQLCDTGPSLGPLAVVGVLVWDVWDYFTLEGSVRPKAPAALPTLSARRDGVSLGLTGRF